MKPIIALDFDGVICDSLEECLVTAYNAYHRLEGSNCWASSTADIKPAVANSFRRLRHYARNAQEFWIIMHWCLTDGGLLSQTQYDGLISTYAAKLPVFEPIFFESRHIFSSADMDRWLGLHRMYTEFQDGWNAVKGQFPVHIVTTKDLISVQYFNRHWQLGIPEECLWTKERIMAKAKIVQRIAVGSGHPIQDVLFVDDHPHHVREVAATGARCFWASWGFLRIPGNCLVDGEGELFTKISRLADLKPYLNS
ncbi:MAG: hypothetical protein JSU77_13305 [Fidelibacterota bacterium]|nr:MAG: hypothetical protein JSU77_13305 [Candidatus Neomarinimicrobiota bacterium]